MAIDFLYKGFSCSSNTYKWQYESVKGKFNYLIIANNKKECKQKINDFLKINTHYKFVKNN